MNKRYFKLLPDKRYFQYLGLLLFALVLFIVYAMVPQELLALKKAELPDGSQSDVEVAGKKDTMNQQEQDSIAQNIQEQLAALDTTSQHFLLIGDSMGEYLRIRLNDYCAQNGHTMQTVIWYSSSTEWYGSCDTLSHFIKKYKPTYILLDLGSNELFVRDIKKKREGYVKEILKQIGDIPYVWIGPPNWKEDTGINDLIVEHVGKGRYFESKKLTYKRGKDHAHPVKSSAFQWMDSIADYLYHHADHRVRMEFPTEAPGKIPHTEILQPKRN